MFHSARSRDLSTLSRGRGLVNGGVEIECFDDHQNFSLSGKAFLQPSGSKDGHYAKPCKARSLALPQTYVTRRGKMVLFTSPEDMVFGKPLQLHHKETVTRNAVRQLRTTTKLRSAAFSYDAEKDSGISDGENLSGEEHISTFPGHFTSVYLQSLQKHSQKAKEDDCTVEDIEAQEHQPAGGGEFEVPQASDCDSGLGQSYQASSGRLSAFSHYSDGTVINIPDGRESALSITEEPDAPTEKTELLRDPHTDLLKQLANQHCSSSRKQEGKDEKKKRTRSHEKKKPKVAKKKGGKGGKPAEQPNETPASGGRLAKKRSKSKKHRKADNQEVASVAKNTHTAEGSMASFDQADQSEQGTAVSLGMDSTEQTFHRESSDRQAQAQLRRSRAEQRRLEIEQKRAKIKELEQQKKLEEEQKALLEEQLQHLSHERHTCTEEMPEDTGDVMETDDHTVDQPMQPPELVVTNSPQRPRSSAHLLAFRNERPARKTKDEAMVSTAVEDRVPNLAPSAPSGSPKREFAPQRLQQALEQGERLRVEHNRQMRLELGSHQRYQSISKPFTFSYFQYVPPKVRVDSQNSKRSRKPRKK